MASPSPRLSFFFPCTALSGSNATYPTAACLLSRSASSPRPDWSHPPPSHPPTEIRKNWATTSTTPDRLPPRSVREALPSLHRPQSAHLAADDLRPVHRDSSGGGALSLGTRRFRNRRLQRWAGRLARPHASSANPAGPIS